MSNELHFYTKLGKEKIKLSSKPIASGGEGALYPIASPRKYKNLIAKIYHPNKRDAEREVKAKYLIKYPPIRSQASQHQAIAWVLDLIYQGDQFVGIIMPKIQGKKLTKLTLNKLPRKAGKAWKRFGFGQAGALKLRLRTCFNIGLVIHQIHESGRYVLVDLKPDNVLMQANGLVALVDMDSVEVIQDGKAIFAAPVATPEYTPPEHYTQNRTTIAETWDRFSLGVIFYQLLFGLHPFAASAKAPFDNLVSLHDKIRQGLYVHHSKRQQAFKVIPPPHKRFYEAPAELQHLFQQCFEEGESIVEARPSALDWCIVLAKLLDLPFTNLPTPSIPPSKLYFLPSTFTNVTNLEQQAPEIHSSLPSLFGPNQYKEPPISGKPIDEKIKKQYRLYLQKTRKILGGSLFLLLISMVLFFFFKPSLIFLGFGGLPLLLYLANYLNYSTVDNLVQKILVYYQATETDLEKVDNFVKNRQLSFDNITAKIDSFRAKIDKNKLVFVQQYCNLRKEFDQQIKDLKVWNKQADKKIQKGRKTEVESYQKEAYEFLIFLKDSQQFKKYQFNSYSSLKTQIELKIQNQTEVLNQIQLKKHKGIKEAFNDASNETKAQYKNRLEKYLKKRKLETKIALNDLTKKTSSPFEIEKDYKRFLHQKMQLVNKATNQKEKIEVLVEKSFLKLRKDMRLSSDNELNDFIALVESSTKEDQEGEMSLQVNQQLESLQKQLAALPNADNLAINSILETLQSFKPNPKIKKKVTLGYNNVNNLSTTMIHARKEVEKELKAVAQKIQELLNNPTALIDKPIDLSYWSSDCKKQINQLHFNLEQHIKLQKSFYVHSSVFELKVHLKRHTLVEKDVQNQQQKVDEKKEEDLERLEKKFADVIKAQIELKNDKSSFEKEILLKQEMLKQKEQEDIKAYQNMLNAELQEEMTTIETRFKDLLDQQELLFKAEHNDAEELLQKANKDLEQLNLHYQEFEQRTENIRNTAEAIYIQKKKLAQAKVNQLNKLLKNIQKDHDQAIRNSSKLQNNYETISNYDKIYQKELIELNQTKQLRVEIENLLQFKKAYNPKIFIKDLLLDRVEQLEKKEPVLLEKDKKD